LAHLEDDQLHGVVLCGKYQLEYPVGKGGMAYVYRAKHTQFNRSVAVKLIFRHLASEAIMQHRFRMEARIQFGLQHSNIVRVFDFVEEQGLLGFVMDWVDGLTLAQWLRTQHFPTTPQIFLPIIEPLLEGMHYAHTQKVVHRDLKPGNLLLAETEGQITPMIVDFGIAKILDEVNEGHTVTGHSLGTPTYMSPEQIRGSREIDHRADLYSLAVILYQMIAGIPPFKKDTGMATAMAHLELPVPLLEAVCPGADMRFQPILEKALAKDPNDRYPNGRAFIAALREVIKEIDPVESFPLASSSSSLATSMPSPAKDLGGAIEVTSFFTSSALAGSSNLQPPPSKPQMSSPVEQTSSFEVSSLTKPESSALTTTASSSPAKTPSINRTQEFAIPNAPTREPSVDAAKSKVEEEKKAQAIPNQPDAAKPDAAKPDAAKPDAAKPDAAKPDAAQAIPNQPDAEKPDAAQAIPNQPDAEKPDAAQAIPNQPDAEKPDAEKPDAVKPDAVKANDVGVTEEKSIRSVEKGSKMEQESEEEILELEDLFLEAEEKEPEKAGEKRQISSGKDLVESEKSSLSPPLSPLPTSVLSPNSVSVALTTNTSAPSSPSVVSPVAASPSVVSPVAASPSVVSPVAASPSVSSSSALPSDSFAGKASPSSASKPHTYTKIPPFPSLSQQNQPGSFLTQSGIFPSLPFPSSQSGIFPSIPMDSSTSGVFSGVPPHPVPNNNGSSGVVVTTASKQAPISFAPAAPATPLPPWTQSQGQLLAVPPSHTTSPSATHLPAASVTFAPSLPQNPPSPPQDFFAPQPESPLVPPQQNELEEYFEDAGLMTPSPPPWKRQHLFLFGGGLLLLFVIWALWPSSKEAHKAPLTPEQVTLRVSSQPEGASLWMDGQPQGETPKSLQSEREKERKIELKKKGFSTVSYTWDAKENKEIRLSLKPLYGLMLQSKPLGASIYLEGREVGKTPHVIRLSAGEVVNLEIKKKGFLTKKHQWTAKGNEEVMLHLAPDLFDLPPPP
jgi:serine/threonine-protein kinase